MLEYLLQFLKYFYYLLGFFKFYHLYPSELFHIQFQTEKIYSISLPLLHIPVFEGIGWKAVTQIKILMINLTMPILLASVWYIYQICTDEIHSHTHGSDDRKWSL